MILSNKVRAGVPNVRTPIKNADVTVLSQPQTLDFRNNLCYLARNAARGHLFSTLGHRRKSEQKPTRCSCVVQQLSHEPESY